MGERLMTVGKVLSVTHTVARVEQVSVAPPGHTSGSIFSNGSALRLPTVEGMSRRFQIEVEYKVEATAVYPAERPGPDTYEAAVFESSQLLN